MTGRLVPRSPYSSLSLPWRFLASRNVLKGAGPSNECTLSKRNPALPTPRNVRHSRIRFHLPTHRRPDCLFLQSRRCRRLSSTPLHFRLVPPASFLRSSHLGFRP